MIKTVKEYSDSYVINGNITVPKVNLGEYADILTDWLKTHTPEPEFTAEELAKQTELEANNLRDKAMLTGVDYQGSMISLTDVDGNGMLQVKAAFEMGLPSTTIHFKNGTKLPMAAADFPAFALWFVTERNRFFV